MSLSDVIRNIAKTVTDKDELKEKAKDLPMFVIQTTLSAAGQALLLVDRVKNSIKGLAAKEEEEEVQETEAPVEKPARREPVIFAPRPSDSEPNGVAKTKPEPVIFSPAGKPTPADETKPLVTETPAAPEPAAVAEPKPAAVAEPKPAAVVAEPEPAAVVEPEPAAVTTASAVDEPVAAPEPAAPAVAEELASAVAAEPAAEPAEKPKTAKPKAAAKPRAARKPAAKKEPAVQDEPLPGYSELTVASLRARMRGKTAEQIKDLLTYEQATTARPQVIKMFENRLAKLEAGE
ncbi:hypothetical protein ACIBHX_21800 [Nonomuraea sp. NPDC050536]|uniref:hypothetical protein n=1 Tax=Nonomuraea sp. NPDC050536 TaxID=3364366 RepID=UPI0037CBC0F4